MSARHYRLLPGLAASLSLCLAACDAASPPDTLAGTGPTAQAPTRRTAQRNPDNTDATLWTMLGLTKTDAERNVGPPTGGTVSPVLWEATLDTLRFAGTSSEDPMTGLFVTKWYSPPGKPDEQLRVTVFVKSRVLNSDSVVVSVERQMRSAGGLWQATPIADDVIGGIQTAILQRARQIHAERYRMTTYR